MKKQDKLAANALLEYDFSGGVRGKYAARYRAGSNIVLLDPDVAAIFKDAASVNRVLRAVASIAAREARAPRARSKKNKR